MEIKATQKYVRMSPEKIRQVVSMIKGFSPEEALERLPFTKKRAADPLSKVIKSALGNAREQGVDTEKLIFKNIQVGKGPSLKRWRSGARGRVKPYEKKMSHIKVVLEEEETKEPKNKKTKKQKNKKPATQSSSKNTDKKSKKNVKSKKKSEKKNKKKDGKSTKKSKKSAKAETSSGQKKKESEK